MNISLADDSPIIACSTSSASDAAISIVRISGFKDLNLFQSSFSIDLSKIEARKIYNCKITNTKKFLDDIMVVYFMGPNSYSGENILEMHVHGNVLNVNRILKYFSEEFNLRYSLPGEFTYRALKNKKLNLSQVEALDLMLSAKSEYALDLGNSLINGSLSKLYKDLLKNYLNHKSSVELGIDFLDDVGEVEFNKNLNNSLRSLYDLVEKLHSRVVLNPETLLNPKIVLFGKTNAGKSSLFNNLLGKNRAIVSEIEGTTRDYISENIFISGSSFVLIDTAGLRATNDKIELAGIEKANELIDESFFKILVINSNDSLEFDRSQVDLIIFTHCDQTAIGKGSSVNEIYLSNRKWSKHLSDLIFDHINKKYLSLISNKPILIARHIYVITAIYNELNEYNKLITDETDLAIISSELNNIGNLIEELVGIVTADNVLSNIFENFCIGK